MITDISHIENVLASLSRAEAGRWRVSTLVEELIYLSRSEQGSPAVFLIGSQDGFSDAVRLAGVSYSDRVLVEPEGRTISALQILGPSGESAERMIVHLAFEMVRLASETPTPPADEILRRCGWLISRIADEQTIMSPEKQSGLVGELQLLTRLCRRAHELHISELRALDSWVGPLGAKRDFAGDKVAVEVKTTSAVLRRHSIGSIAQLEPQADEETVYLYSVGVQQDASAPRRLTHFIRDVESLLAPDCALVFKQRLRAAGFDDSQADAYARSHGFLAFHLIPRMYSGDSVERLTAESFVGGHPPQNVSDISYKLLLTGDPVTLEAEKGILDRLLKVGSK